MKIYSWNVNGLRAVLRKGALQQFLEEQHPDILCLQEIKAKPDQVDYDFPGYKILWNPANRLGYSGTAILFSEQLTKFTGQNPRNIEGHKEKIYDFFAEGAEQCDKIIIYHIA